MKRHTKSRGGWLQNFCVLWKWWIYFRLSCTENTREHRKSKCVISAESILTCFFLQNTPRRDAQFFSGSLYEYMIFGRSISCITNTHRYFFYHNSYTRVILSPRSAFRLTNKRISLNLHSDHERLINTIFVQEYKKAGRVKGLISCAANSQRAQRMRRDAGRAARRLRRDAEGR